ncbi:MAG: protein kinase [Succinimonas sp.]|nr:protein kinase [Succinimonas sp.]
MTSTTKLNLSFLSRLKNTVLNKSASLPDITGKTLGEFHADRRMDLPSGEADIYLCSGTGSHAGERFVLKYYRRENAVKQDVLEKLRGIKSPCVAPVAGYGVYEGHQYAVRPFYEMPALSEALASGTTITEEEQKALVIPSVIAGLKAVHDAGILHKDLKPANLIPDDTGEHIVLMDFGISSDAGKNTFVVTQTGMTPFYAAPEAMQGIFHKETDYYALGITIFELFTGFTPFQNPELNPEEAARLASVSKIEFPANFPDDLRKLVLGLTYKDISHRNEKDNPNRRWGYDEVRRWLNGEEVPVPGEIPSAPGFIAGDSKEAGASSSAGTPASGDPFQAYRFNGKTYTAESDLLRAMLEHPEAGLKDLGRGFLSHHYYALSEKKGALCEYAEKKLAGKEPGSLWANTRILYALIYSLNPEVREISFNGQILNSVQDLGRAFIDAGTKEALQNHGLRGQSYPLTQAVKEFVLSGIPEDYAVTVLKNTAVKDLFSKTAALWKNNEHSESDTELALILGYSLCDDRRIPIGGKIYESPEVFRNEMAELVSKDRSAYMKLMETAKRDLDFLEKNLPDASSRKALSQARDDVKLAVFGDNEYYFKNGQDFQSHIQKLVNEEKPYEIRSLLNRYKTPLKQVSEKVWGTDSLGNLQKTVAGFIQIGEYLFTGEKAFRDFITGVMERGRLDPAYLLSFVKAHRKSLDSAARAFPGIKKNVAALYAANDAVIVFDEEMFPDLPAFKAFVTETLNHGQNDPGYILEFVKRHRSAIDDLLKNPECGTVLKPLTDAAERLIVLGSRIFTTVANFETYLNEVIAAGRADPGYLCRFVNNHSKELSDLRRDNRCKSILNALYAARNQIVAFDELIFRSPEEFQSFMEQILSKGKENPAGILRFVREHEKSLVALSNVSALAPVVAPVIAAGNSVIELDEYVFKDAESLVGFARDLSRESRVKPLMGADFVREHKAGLEVLKSDEALAPTVKELQALEHSGEKGAAIMVNGTKYSPITIKKGEYLKFGSYPQINGNTKEPIEWLVLEVNDQEALLVSRYGLDCKQYYHQNVSMTWENCDLRKWLNSEFLKTAFTEKEQSKIRLSEVVNDDNPEFDTRGGNNTRDRVFCLSLAEAERYFKNDGERKCKPTGYARNQGAWVDNSNGCCYWWLRSPGLNQYGASGVLTDGALYPYGNFVYYVNNAVRPALRLIWNR